MDLKADILVFPEEKSGPVGAEVVPGDLENGGSLVGVSRTQPSKKFPVFMLSISMTQVLFFYIGRENLWLLLGYDPFRRHELWRYYTIMLVHSSQAHLWGNIIFQLIVGCILEVVHHWRRSCIIYVLGVLGGSLANTIFNPKSYSVGASAGGYALLAAHLATIIINWSEMKKKCCRLFWLFLYISLDVGFSVYVELVLKLETNTSHAIHFGGALTGFIVAFFVLKSFKKQPWERRFQLIFAVLISILFGVVVVVNVAWTSHYEPTVWNTNYVETFMRYLVQIVFESEPDSELREWCLADEDCQNRLQEYAESINKAIELANNRSN